MEELGWEIVSIPLRYGTTVFKQERFDVEYIRKCQFLLGTVQHDNIGNIKVKVSKKCQFLLGTVQHDLNTLDTPRKWLYVSIPLRYGTTWPEKNCSI